MEKKLKIIIGVLSAIILALAAILVIQLSKKTEVKEVVHELTIDKHLLHQCRQRLRLKSRSIRWA